jgi:hypothetical protein
MQLLSQSLSSLSANVSGITGTVNGHTQNIAALGAAQSGFAASSSLNSHTGNAAVHCTAAEKALWNSQNANQNSNWVFGTFNGDSAATRKITLGYAPKFVLVFPANYPLFEAAFTTGALYVYSAAGIQNNAAKGLRLETDGFTVVYSTAVNAGASVRTNQSGITYGYLVCK